MEYITQHDIVQAFRSCGIKPGATLILHSDAIFLAQTRPMSQEDKCALFFAAMDEVLGPDGTLVVPTFTYSATDGQPFYVETTPSTVGILTEYFRTLPNVRRSSDPVFSVAVRGKAAADFESLAVGDAFGPQSVFGLIHQRNAWIACLGCSFDRITFTHYVEQQVGVSYRFFKEFPYSLLRNGSEQSGTLRYYVRYLDRDAGVDLSRLKVSAVESGTLHTAPVGRLGLMTIASNDFFEQAVSLLKENEKALIMEGRQ